MRRAATRRTNGELFSQMDDMLGVSSGAIQAARFEALYDRVVGAPAKRATSPRGRYASGWIERGGLI